MTLLRIKIHIKYRVLLYAISLILFNFSPLSASNEVTLAGETQHTAIQSPFVKCAFEAIGRDVRIVAVSWTRAQHGTKNGDYDGFFMAAQNKDRDLYATLSKPFYEIDWVYVMRTDNDIKPSDLNFFQHRFSVQNGTARHNWLINKLSELGISGNIFSSQKTDRSLELLLMGRIDVALENSQNLDKAYLEENIGPSLFKTFVVKAFPIGVYFSNYFLNAEPDFIKQFNEAVITCR